MLDSLNTLLINQSEVKHMSQEKLFPDMKANFFTVGYQGLTQAHFIVRLQRKGVKTLVDVRKYPMSRSVGFNKMSLSSACEIAGIKYIHEGKLGNPKSNWGNPNWRINYSRLINPEMENVIKMMNSEKQPIAFMCMEKSCKECHREVLGKDLGRHGFIGEEIT